MKIVICSGGTGGHMFPACALYHELLNRNHDVLIVTDKRGSVFCGDINDKVVLNTIRFSLKKIFSIIPKLVKSFFSFVNVCIKHRPDVVIGFGGSFTLLPMIVSKMFNAKVIIYEQNAIVGKANQLLSIIGDVKLSSFDIDETWRMVTAPVRMDFVEQNVNYTCNNKVRITIIGGSQGAKSFSDIIPESLKLLHNDDLRKIEIFQQVKADAIETLLEKYNSLGVTCHLIDFIENIASVMSKTQLVICRAGASTLSELSYFGCPAILIPLSTSAQNHQYFNALYYEQKGAAWLVEEKEDVEAKIASLIHDILQNNELLKIASSNMINPAVKYATKELASIVESVC